MQQQQQHSLPGCSCNSSSSIVRCQDVAAATASKLQQDMVAQRLAGRCSSGRTLITAKV
jgi:hypothetical protein